MQFCICLYLFSDSYPTLIDRYGNHSMYNVDVYGKYTFACAVERLPKLREYFGIFIKEDPELYSNYLECLRRMSLENMETQK